MSTRTIRTHIPAPARLRPTARLGPTARAGPRRTARRPARKHDSLWIPLITVLAVSGALTLVFIAGYHFVLPILAMLDNN
jgi:hypothetical protein